MPLPSVKTNVVHLVRPELPDAENWLSAQWQWKYDGTNIVEWSQEEIDATAATNEVQQVTAQREIEKAMVEIGALKATVKVMIDEINLLRLELNQGKTNGAAWRAAPTLPLRTASQARTAIKGEIDEQ